MSFLNIALHSISRGWHVFPCWPAMKKPLIEGGAKWTNASSDETQVRAWWARWPDANVAIAGNGSGLAVLDIDHGLENAAAWHAWCDRNGIPETYTVRTGRRPEFGVQMYFAGAVPDVGEFQLDGCSGQIKSMGGYVMAAGSIHPDTGETYQVLCDVPPASLPAVVRALHTKQEKTDSGNAKVGKTAWSLPVHEGENRTGFLLEQTGAMRNLGCGFESILARMRELNEHPDIIADPVDEDRVQATARNCAKFSVPAPPPEVTIGGSKPKAQEQPQDWRTRYHTFDEMTNAPPPVFIVDGFLQRNVITAIAGLVSQRKTIIAANVVHASITGKPLFDHFKVKNRPKRVLYLCPEMGLYSFADRIRKLGLMEQVGKTLFCRTMNSEGSLSLKDLTKDELAGALVVVDTAVRFVEGDENSSEDMKVFAEDCFRLVKDGASVLVLFHSPKGMADVSELTLENAMRGSGDLGAFVSCCWATRLQDPEHPWESESYLKNVKQRDFESDPFTVKSDKQGCLHVVTAPGSNVKLSSKKPGNKADKDGREAEALQIIRDNPKLSLPNLVAKLAERGIDRKASWVGNKRREVFGGGVTTGEENQPSTTQ